MKQRDAALDCYNKTSQEYADAFLRELEAKPLDRLLLKSFAEENAGKGLMVDLACGPGQTTQFLYKAGVQDLLGVDLAPRMVEVARSACRNEIEFAVGDMLQLSFEDDRIGSALCFYGIVHFSYPELKTALGEIRRVLKAGGRFLFSFHIGTGTKSVDEFLGQKVKLDFYFFEVEKVLALLQELGWKQIEVVERHPYEGVEFPSKRAYLTVEK